MKKHPITIVSFVLFSCMTGCMKESFENLKESGEIRVVLSNAYSLNIETKSSKAPGTVLLGTCLLDDIDGLDFNVDAYVSDLTDLTKGSIVSDDGAGGMRNLNSIGSTFTLNGWLGSAEGRAGNSDETNRHFISDALVTRESDGWSLNPKSTWRNGVPTTFWSWYPVVDDNRDLTIPGENASGEEQKALSFTYTTPEDVSKHNDLIFAYNLQTVDYDGQGHTDDNEVVAVHFYHALTAIRFDVSGALKNGITINSVFFEDVVMEGKCDVSGESNGSVSSPGAVSFAWNSMDRTGTVSQNVESVDFSEVGLDGTTANALMPLGSEKFFLLIPQEVNGKVKIGITYTRSDGSVHSKTSVLSHSPWLPGKLYTYQLNPAADFVDVEISENVNSNVKSNVQIMNTGNVYEYLRAAIIGNWVVSDGTSETLIGPWSFDASSFIGLNVGPDKGWSISSDGFFYSNEKVAPGEGLLLFDSYTAPEAPAPHATLNLYILSQGVAAGSSGDWSDSVAAIKSSSISND